MKRMCLLLLAAAPFMLGSQGAGASTAYGDLNNFDTVNDTGQECHGFEIEIDDIHSTDITYTYDWNHYGPPKISEDKSDPAHPKVIIRYESAKNPDGTWASYTASPSAPLTPTDGHSCTNPSVNQGCEHFGVGYYGTPTAIRYNWLVDSGGVLVHHTSPVMVATPSWTYQAPAAGQPAVVVAVIPAPVVPIPEDPQGQGRPQFGEPSFVKVIKTTTHNANNVALRDLVSDDTDGDGNQDWQNAEPAEVESEFKLLQANDSPDVVKDELPGQEDDMGDGAENVTRRYEFYKYAGDATTVDGENREAMCDEVASADPNDPQYLHGVGDQVAVTDANGDTQYVNCAAQVVVGDYIGAQMAGFDAAMPLGLVDHLQDGETGVDYPPRSVVLGGDSPYVIVLTSGSLPGGLQLGDYTDPVGNKSYGVLHGTPTIAGHFPFTVEATDASGAVTSNSYILAVAGDGVVTPQHVLSVDRFGSGTGTVSGSGIDCGATCEVVLDEGTVATLSATADAGSNFTGWGGACAGTAVNENCVVTVNADTAATANFALPQHQLAVSKDGSGTGTVSGNGINCGAACDVALAEGTEATLAATADAGSVFNGWGGACTGTGSCVVTVNADTAVSASFTKQYQLAVSKEGSGTGTVSGNGINCGATCDVALNEGTQVELTAIPTGGSVFIGWGGDCSGTGLCNTTMNASHQVTATFVPVANYTLSVTTSGKGTVRDGDPKGINCGNKCSKNVTVGTTVTLTAKPKGKAVFLGWSGACSGTTALICTVPMLSNQSVGAVFN